MKTRPQEDLKEDQGAMEKLGSRVRQRTMTGTEASTIGFILVAYIGVFAGLGYWLDTYFKTSWIVAVGVLGGAALGFREMFRMAQKLTRDSILDDAKNEREKWSKARQVQTPITSTQASEEVAPETQSRARIFNVPAPPVSSFDKTKSHSAITPADEDLDSEELIDRLLKKDELDEDEKP